MIDEFYKEIGARLVCIKKGTKSPNRAGWPKIQDRFEEIEKEFNPEIHNKVGWILDENHLVIDVDTHDNGPDGFKALDDLSEKLNFDLYDVATNIVRSPSGGAHLYFIKDPNIKLPKSSKDYPGLDFLSAGSQVITAGSFHDQKQDFYFFEKKSDFFLPIMTQTLLEVLGGGKEEKSTTQIIYADQECRPGDAYKTSRKGFDHFVAEMELSGYTLSRNSDPLKFSHPNKTDASFSHSGSIKWLDEAGHWALWNYSTSDLTWENGKSIDLFSALSQLKGWSFKETASYLADLGFATAMDVEDIRQSVSDWAEHLLNKTPETKNTFDQLPSYEIAKRIECRTFDELDDLAGGLRRPYVIDGLLRVGEVMNVIAAPKVGKSWLVYNLALSTACGREFLGYRASKNLNVLLIDNELHWEELAWRMQQVATHMNVAPQDSLKISCLRGMDISLAGIEKLLDEMGSEQFDLIIIDALYRILPAGASENDNAQMTALYNRLDLIAGKSSSAVICIHHTSKGSQATKGVTDVGAGAGAISRAADTHLVIRPHRDDPYFVIDALTRSGKSPDPVVAELDWPLWVVAEDVLPELKEEGPPAKQDKKQTNIDLCLDLIDRDGETTTKDISSETGISEAAIRGYLKDLEIEGKVELIKQPYKPTRILRTASEPVKLGEEWQPE